MSGNVLITGAGGYIGANAAEYFARRGFRVFGTTHRKVAPRLEKLAGESGVTVLPLELDDSASIDALFARETYDYVLHIAARASDVGREELFRSSNFDAVRQLASAALRQGVKRFVYLSTSDVYGLHDFHGESEGELDFDPNVRNFYPKYKILAEKWLAANLPGERYAVVRPCAVWGNGDTTLTPRALAYLKSSPVVLHFGKWRGRNRWPLAHVENVCAMLLAAALLPETAGTATHVLDTEFTTVSEFYRRLQQKFLPDKVLRELTLPVWTIRPAALFSSWLSTRLNRYQPVFDPSNYALDTIIHNLDFSNTRMCGFIQRAGEKVISSDAGGF